MLLTIVVIDLQANILLSKAATNRPYPPDLFADAGLGTKRRISDPHSRGHIEAIMGKGEGTTSRTRRSTSAGGVERACLAAGFAPMERAPDWMASAFGWTLEHATDAQSNASYRAQGRRLISCHQQN